MLAFSVLKVVYIYSAYVNILIFNFCKPACLHLDLRFVNKSIFLVCLGMMVSNAKAILPKNSICQSDLNGDFTFR